MGERHRIRKHSWELSHSSFSRKSHQKMNICLEDSLTLPDHWDLHCPILQPPAPCDYWVLFKCGLQEIKNYTCDLHMWLSIQDSAGLCVAQIARVCTSSRWRPHFPLVELLFEVARVLFLLTPHLYRSV